MKCPYCHCLDTKVVDKRETSEHSITRRRRECLKCAKRFTTHEKVQYITLDVIKKDNTKEAFDKEKIRKGILRACEKRPVTLEKIDLIVDKIESDLMKLKSTEIKTETIGKKVAKVLKSLDKVAYIRFASVYNDFDDIKDFQKEIKEITVTR